MRYLYFLFISLLFIPFFNYSQNDPVYGCNEPLACNYNPDATINDGSCQYGICGVDCVDVEFSGSSGGNWEVIDSNGNTVVSNLPLPSYACLDPNECYQVYLSGGEDGQSINTSGWGGWLDVYYNYGWTDGYMWIGNNNYVYDYNFPVPTLYLDGIAYNLSSGVENSFPFGTCYVEEIYGCLEPDACNYNQNATVSIPCLYPNDLDGDPCLVCTGDGNGNMSFSYQDFDFDGICDNDEIYGCTDPQACNYNADATELVDCQYGLCDGNCVDVEVSGSSGGNWEVIDSNGNTVVSNLPLPSYACLDPNECYQVYLSGGEDGQSINTSGWGGWLDVYYNYGWTDGYMWIGSNNYVYDYNFPIPTLYLDGIAYNLSSGVENSFPFGTCYVEEIYGCLEPDACNYNQNATVSIPCLYLI